MGLPATPIYRSRDPTKF